MKHSVEAVVILIFVLFVAQFIYVSSFTNAEYSGSDGQGGDMVKELTGGEYELIAEPIWEPPSGEIESLLFVVQAAIGSIIIGYFLGYYSRRHKSKLD